jgi:type II restriction/modification system DNA methylase subunit YeeA
MTGGADLKIIIDLSASEVPKEVVLPLRTVLKLTISALKQTLKDSHLIENRPLKVTLELAGLTEKTGSLRDLAGRFEVGGR